MMDAVIIGGRGQDGQLLAGQLERAGRSVLPVVRGDMDLLDRDQVAAFICRHAPRQLYYLAAHHHSSEDPLGSDDAALFRNSFDINVTGLVHTLEAVRLHSPATRVFYAGSSHVFGQSGSPTQNEQTPLTPRCIYGITKTTGIHCCRYYRNTHGIFAAAGILYNHESPLRPPRFVSRKITDAARAIAAGGREKLVIGDLTARVDWGYAPDYVDAMQRILSLPQPDDFIVATGETHSVEEFVDIAFAAVGLDWRMHVVENRDRITKQQFFLTGDASKLRATTGWKPSVSFQQMVRLLLDTGPHES